MSNIVTFPDRKEKSSACDSSSCSSSSNEKPSKPETPSKEDRHPCYSENAQHQYARLHLPVAPACNMQCNYCNRKFDCSNESRPGVVSCLLTPQQALERVERVSEKLENLAVVGIAGPGDPLANPDKTFSTIEMLNKQFPDLITCLSTNGLNLNSYADDVISLGAKHITVTLNTIDPFVGKQIYDWIYFDGAKFTGVEAAEILIQEQLDGIKKMVASGARVKINSVMIPGVNEMDIPNVSRVIKELGVEIHNIMPLISQPEFDTHFSRIGQREPTYEELTQLRDNCGIDMKMMRHCRQCRADAVGLLGEDQSGCFSKKGKKENKQLESYPEPHQPKEVKKEAVAATTAKPMHIAVTTKSHNLINQHFGHATQFLIYRIDEDKVEFEGVRRVDQYCVGSCDDDKESTLDKAIEVLKDVDVVLTARIGHYPREKLKEAGIKVCIDYAMEVIDDAAREYCKATAMKQSV